MEYELSGGGVVGGGVGAGVLVGIDGEAPFAAVKGSPVVAVGCLSCGEAHGLYVGYEGLAGEGSEVVGAG